MYQYRMLSKLVYNGEVKAYKVQLTNKDTIEIIGIAELLSKLKTGAIEVENVKLTKTGKLRGCNGFFLSRLPEETLKNIAEVNSCLLVVLKYIIKQISSNTYEDICYGSTLKGITAYCYVEIRLENNQNMTELDANTDLRETLDFYNNHLPKELDGYVDSIFGEVDDLGITRITVTKQVI